MYVEINNPTCDVKDDLTPRHKLRLGAPAEFFVEKSLNRICQIDCQYEIEFGLAKDLLHHLQNDRYDGVIATKRYDMADLEFTMLEEETFYIVAPKDFVLPDSFHLTEDWLTQQRWISYGKEMPIIRRVWRQHFNKRLSAEPFHVIPDLRGILKSVEMGMGISMLPCYLIHESVKAGKIKILSPELSVNNHLYLAYKQKNKGMPHFQQLIQKLRMTKQERK